MNKNIIITIIALLLCTISITAYPGAYSTTSPFSCGTNCNGAYELFGHNATYCNENPGVCFNTIDNCVDGQAQGQWVEDINVTDLSGTNFMGGDLILVNPYVKCESMGGSPSALKVHFLYNNGTGFRVMAVIPCPNDAWHNDIMTNFTLDHKTFGNQTIRVLISFGADNITCGYDDTIRNPEWSDTDDVSFYVQPDNCTIDSDCGTCRYCNAGTCDFQPNEQDPNNDCAPGEFGACFNDYTYEIGHPSCNGIGQCEMHIHYNNVSTGAVCLNGMNSPPNINVSCHTWKNCITNRTNASEYFVGYQGDGTSNCNDTNWQATGNTWDVILGYRINETTHSQNCTIEYYNQPIIIYRGGGGGNFPETTSVIAPAPAPAPTTFSLGGFIQSIGLKALWASIKTWLLSLGVKI